MYRKDEGGADVLLEGEQVTGLPGKSPSYALSGNVHLETEAGWG